MTQIKCPFCGERQDSSGSFGGMGVMTRWMCGTVGPDINGEFSTGTRCDKNVFRNGFLRCYELLKRISECKAYSTRDDGVTLVSMDSELLKAITKEVEGVPKGVVE